MYILPFPERKTKFSESFNDKCLKFSFASNSNVYINYGFCLFLMLSSNILFLDAVIK